MKILIFTDSSGTVLRAVAESEPDTVKVVSIGHSANGQSAVQPLHRTARLKFIHFPGGPSNRRDNRLPGR